MIKIKELIENCPDEKVAVLPEDVEEMVDISSKRNLTIDLGGHVWTAPKGKTALTVRAGSKVKLINGTIRSDASACVLIGGPDESFSSIVELGPDLVLSATDYPAVVLSSYGQVYSYANISNTGAYGAIQGSLMNPIRPRLCKILGGTISSANAAGILWLTSGDLSILGGSVTGVTGVEMRSGALYLRGGIVTGTSATSSAVSNPSGVSTAGAGVAVAQLTSEQGVEVVITRGKVSASTPFMDVNAESLVKGRDLNDFAIIGGEFTITGSGTASVSSADHVDFINGGTFSKAPDMKYLSVGTYVKSQGKVYVADSPKWEYPEDGATGFGLTGNRRLIYHIDEVVYPKGGFALALYGFDPQVILSVSVIGGASFYFDAKNRVLHLYRKGMELSGVLRDLTIMMIGN